MKKLLIFLLTVFLYLNLLFSVQAQENQNKTINYICLKKDKCWEEGVNCTTKNAHRVRLITDPGKKFPPNKEVYIAECLYFIDNGQNDYRCTTGNPNLDKSIWGESYNGISELQNKLRYSLSGADPSGGGELGIFKIENNKPVKIDPQPFTTNNTGETPILEWQSYTEQSIDRKWYGFFINQTQEEMQMGQGSLQQGKVDFPPFQDKDCTSIAWDPAGRVFDAKTLEPIPDVKVMLSKNYNGQFTDARKTELTIINPYVTKEDGGFSFYVSNGEYKLVPSHPNYSFPVTSLNEIHPNYQNIYLNPRYGKPGESKTLIYPFEPSQNGEIIRVSNRMEFRDIPLKPNNNIGYNYPLKVYSFVHQLNKLTQEIIFSGKASHPFTKVILYKKNFNENNQEFSQVYGSYLSDYLGKFNFSIPLSTLKPNEIITDVKFETSDLTNLNNKNQQTLIQKIINLLGYLNNKVIAQQNNIVHLKLNPVTPKIDGIAYDNNGKILPKTKVGIYLTFSNVPYYTTITDEKGYLKIPTTKLPNEPFEIRYQTPMGMIKVSTTQFVKQNTQYLTKNKINLNQVVDENNRIITPTKISPTKTKDFRGNNYSDNSQLPTTNQSVTSKPTTNKINLVLLPLMILIILIISVAFLLFFYYQKNKSQPQI